MRYIGYTLLMCISFLGSYFLLNQFIPEVNLTKAKSLSYDEVTNNPLAEIQISEIEELPSIVKAPVEIIDDPNTILGSTNPYNNTYIPTKELDEEWEKLAQQLRDAGHANLDNFDDKQKRLMVLTYIHDKSILTQIQKIKEREENEAK